MPYATLNQTKIHYTDSDPKNADKPVIFFAHGLLWDNRLWQHQVAALKDAYRCICMDFRGQGKSKVSRSGYDMNTLTEDVIALLDYLKVEKCHFIGLSMGGFVGQRIAIKHPSRLLSLSLLNTSGEAEDLSKAKKYKKLILAARVLGMQAVAGRAVEVMFGEDFLIKTKQDRTTKKAFKTYLKRLKNNRRKGVLRAVKGVIERDSVIEKAEQIYTPTLIIAGAQDKAIACELSQKLHLAIVGSKCVVLPKVGHTSTLEAPEKVNDLLKWFLVSI